MERPVTTYTGRKIFLSNIKKEDFCIDDIIYALSMLCRYTGHTKHFYPVLLHEINCYYVAKHYGYTIDELLYVLLHDSTEAYIGDVITPVKNLCPDIRVMEKSIYACILDSLGISLPDEETSKKVKEVDTIAFYKEWDALMPDDIQHEYKNIDFLGFCTDDLPASEVREQYKSILNEILNERK